MKSISDEVPIIRGFSEISISLNANTDEIIIIQNKKFICVPLIFAQRVADAILAQASIMNFGGMQ